MPSNAHLSHLQQSQHPRTSSIVFKEEATRVPTTQLSATGRISRYLFRAIFFTQLTLVSVFVIVLTLRGLISAGSHHFHPKKWYPPLLTSVAVSGTLSLASQCILLSNASAMLKAVFYLSPVFTCSVGILLALINSTTAAAIGAAFVLFAIVQSLYACWVAERFEYATKILSASSLIPPAKTKAIISLSVTMSVLYSGYLVTGMGGSTSSGTKLDILFKSILMLSLTWTMQVLKNIQVVAISRSRYVNFACGEDMDGWNAFCVTVKHLFGSVCIGSIVVPAIVFIRGSARSIKLLTSGGEDFMFSCANCYSSIGNSLIMYGNRWGFVHVGIYDKGFIDASYDTWGMFRGTTGLEQLIDSDLTGSFCFLCGVIMGSVSALTAGIWTLVIHKDYTLEVTLYAWFLWFSVV